MKLEDIDCKDYFSSERKKLFRDFIKGNTKIAGKEITVSLFTSLLSMIGAILVGIWLVQKTIEGTITVSEFLFADYSNYDTCY